MRFQILVYESILSYSNKIIISAGRKIYTRCQLGRNIEENKNSCAFEVKKKLTYPCRRKQSISEYCPCRHEENKIQECVHLLVEITGGQTYCERVPTQIAINSDSYHTGKMKIFCAQRKAVTKIQDAVKLHIDCQRPGHGLPSVEFIQEFRRHHL